jgi:hypothetical protein
VETLILFAPAVHYGLPDLSFGLKENGLEHFASVRASWPHTYRIAPDPVWKEIVTGTDPLPTPRGEHPSLKRVYIVVGALDKYFDISVLTKNVHKIVSAYCGPRVAQTLVVIPGAGHYLDELVEAGAHFSLSKMLAAV